MHAVGGVTNAKVGTGNVDGNDLSRSSGSGMEMSPTQQLSWRNYLGMVSRLLGMHQLNCKINLLLN